MMRQDKSGKVSIVIPVYNGEAFLRECLDSVLGQSYSNLEVILVNDGSTDATAEIAAAYAACDERIHIYDLENGGVSKARNYALGHVSGKYLYFADADDTLEPDTLERLLDAMLREQAQLSVCRYYKKYQGIHLPNKRLEPAGTYSREEYYIHTMRDPGHHYYGVLWNKLYQAEMIAKWGYRFREDVTLGEDFIFNLHYLQRCERIAVLEEPLYHYRRSGPDSLSRKHIRAYEDCRNEWKNRMEIYQEYTDILKKMNLYTPWKKKIQKYWISFYIRQKYQLRFGAGAWNQSEREAWINFLENDLFIQECIKSRTKIYLFCYNTCFTMQTLIKSLLKKLI